MLISVSILVAIAFDHVEECHTLELMKTNYSIYHKVPYINSSNSLTEKYKLKLVKTIMMTLYKFLWLYIFYVIQQCKQYC